jgi:hypothetical protein
VLCKTHLGLSTSLAEKLVHVVSTMTRAREQADDAAGPSHDFDYPSGHEKG